MKTFDVSVSVKVEDLLEGGIGRSYRIESPNKSDAESEARKRFRESFPSITKGKKLQIYSQTLEK